MGQELIFQANKSFFVYIIAIFVNFGQCGDRQKIVTDDSPIVRRCEGNSVVTLQENGDKRKENCSESQICQSGQCIEQEKPSMCPKPGNHCKGNTLVTCQENGKRVETECSENETCRKGSCIGKEWVIDAGGSGEDNAHDVAVDAKGNVYYSGYLHGGFSFHGEHVSGPSGYIAKANKHGDHVWSIVFHNDGKFSGVSNIEIAPDGSLYALGLFKGRLSVQGKEFVSGGSLDGFIFHVSDSGKFMKFQQFKSTNEVIMKGLAVDKSGNVYTTGLFRKSIEIDGQLNVSSGHANVFVSKLTKEGQMAWFRSSQDMISLARDSDVGVRLADIVVTEKQDIFVSGFFSDRLKFEGQEIYSKGSTDIYLSKWDTDGNMYWLKGHGGIGAESNYSIATDKKNNVYLAGGFTGEFELGSKTLRSKNPETSDVLVTKWDEDGHFVWAATAGGEGGMKNARDWEIASKISVSKHGIFITGSFQKSIQFDGITLKSEAFFPKTPNFIPYPEYKRMENSTECFVAQLDQNGKFVWATTPEGTAESWDRGMSIAHNANFLYISGKYSGERKMSGRVLNAKDQFLNLFIWKMLKPSMTP